MTELQFNKLIQAIKFAAYAQHWTAYAQSDVCKMRKIMIGNREMTELEKQADAFNTAKTHIQNIDMLMV